LKIVDYKIFIIDNPAPHFGGRYWILLKLITDNGLSGIGEAYSVPFHPHVVARMIEDVLERIVIGHDPFKIEKLWRTLYTRAYTGRPDLSMMAVISAIEIASWDIIGKALEVPVYQLLGGKIHEKLRTYTYLYPKESDQKDVYTDPELAAQRAYEYVQDGFTAIKFDPIGSRSAFDPRQLTAEDLDHVEMYVANIREAVGAKCDLLLGTHGQMTTSSAIQLAKKLEPYGLLWFEEPVPPENISEMSRVANATSIPIATGERLTTKYEFSSILQNQAASIIQMAIGRVGGILESKKIAGMAEAYYAQIAPHLYCSPIEGAANIQLDVCSPNFLIQEGILNWGGFHAEILKKPIVWQEGYIIPPLEPGLGIELNEEVVVNHPYLGEELHLEMINKPIY
jgi:galactonate dehydratase